MRGVEIPDLISTYKDTLLPVSCEEALEKFTDRINDGNHWTSALLDAVNLWTLSEEIYKGRLHRYLIHGEAFDFKLLAYRFLQPVRSLIPLEEYRCFLLGENFPKPIFGQNLRKSLGPIKYQGYLNYWYGITVEMALQLAVLNEVRKEQAGRGRVFKRYNLSEVYSRIYGSVPVVLFEQYRQTFKWSLPIQRVFGNSKEFVYWLFKLRISRCEKERVASDTKKALEWLQQHGALLDYFG